MAIVTFSITDTIDSHVTKMNRVSSTIGDIRLIGEENVTELVSGLNAFRNRLADLDESAEVLAAIRSGISVNSIGQYGFMSYTDSTGVITYSGPESADFYSRVTGFGNLSFDSAQMFLDGDLDASFITDNTLSYTKEVAPTTFIIYNDSVTIPILTFSSPST